MPSINRKLRVIMLVGDCKKQSKPGTAVAAIRTSHIVYLQTPVLHITRTDFSFASHMQTELRNIEPLAKYYPLHSIVQYNKG